MFGISEGSPFFVQEITRLLLKSGQVEEREGQRQLKPGVDLSVPTGLAGLLCARISRLGSSVETALKTAAVIGRELPFHVLCRLVPLSLSEIVCPFLSGLRL